MFSPETFTLLDSLVLIGGISAAVFSWRFYLLRARQISLCCSLPSVLVAGVKNSGKSSLIAAMTGSEASPHPFFGSLPISYAGSGRNVTQFVELPFRADRRREVARMLGKVKFKSAIFIFDVSRGSPSVGEQSKYLQSLRARFPDLEISIVTSKNMAADPAKVRKVRSEFGSVRAFEHLTGDANLRKDYDALEGLRNDLGIELSKEKGVSSVRA